MYVLHLKVYFCIGCGIVCGYAISMYICTCTYVVECMKRSLGNLLALALVLPPHLTQGLFTTV